MQRIVFRHCRHHLPVYSLVCVDDVCGKVGRCVWVGVSVCCGRKGMVVRLKICEEHRENAGDGRASASNRWTLHCILNQPPLSCPRVDGLFFHLLPSSLAPFSRSFPRFPPTTAPTHTSLARQVNPARVLERLLQLPLLVLGPMPLPRSATAPAIS